MSFRLLPFFGYYCKNVSKPTRYGFSPSPAPRTSEERSAMRERGAQTVMGHGRQLRASIAEVAAALTNTPMMPATASATPVPGANLAGVGQPLAPRSDTPRTDRAKAKARAQQGRASKPASQPQPVAPNVRSLRKARHPARAGFWGRINTRGFLVPLTDPGLRLITRRRRVWVGAALLILAAAAASFLVVMLVLRLSTPPVERASHAPPSAPTSPTPIPTGPAVPSRP